MSGESGRRDHSGDEHGYPSDQHGLPVAPSNVRDPWKGLRGVMAGILAMEFVVVALALAVVGQFGGGLTTAGLVSVAVLALLLLAAAFIQRKSWGLTFALVLQVLLVACGIFHVVIGVMGLIFLLIWGYVLWLRREVARRMREGRLADQLGHPPGYPPREAPGE